MIGSSRVHAAIVCVILASAGPVRSQAPVFSPSQAIASASSFCSQIGAPVSGAPTAVFPAPSKLPSAQDTYWQPHWRVSFPGQADVEVVDGSGAICYYTNNALQYQIGQSNQPEGTAISQADAMTIATGALQAAGPAAELAFERADLRQTGDPPLMVSHDWTLIWKRQLGGIDYRDQHAAVTLQAETGGILGLAVVFPSPPPASTSRTITGQQAADIAGAQLAATGVSDAQPPSTTLQIVQPNTFWVNGDARPLPGVPVTSWACWFGSSRGAYQVWVDAQSGTVVGGELIGIRDSRASILKGASLQETLRSARSVRLYTRDKHFDWSGPLVVLSSSSHSHLLRRFRSQGRFISIKPTLIARYKLVVDAGRGKAVDLSYDPPSGSLFGSAPGSALVSTDVREAIVKLIAQSRPGR